MGLGAGVLVLVLVGVQGWVAQSEHSALRCITQPAAETQSHARCSIHFFISPSISTYFVLNLYR